MNTTMNKPTIAPPHRRRPTDANLRLLGNWQLECIAASGSLTNVYFARPIGCATNWPSDYAIKTLKPPHDQDPLAINLLKREAEVGQDASNPHLVPILESKLDAPPYFIVMPKLPGAALHHAIAAIGPLAIPQALWITRQIAEALKQLHIHGWVHADVKPANIMVSSEGHATLLDFGCALRSDESIFSWERPIVGTLHYIAPEMVTSRLRTDCRCDIYSLGVTLFELLSGRVPFVESDQAKLVEAHLRAVPPDLRKLRDEIPREVAELVRCMLAKEPLRRPQTASELIERLTDLEIETLDARIAA
jgi:serine/threonine-protein kinase